MSLTLEAVSTDCAECGIPLSPDECHVCEGCSLTLLDPNFDMTGGDDGEPT